ncbi:MAG: hypothetical protein ABI565_14585 [Vicinamibacteria bacterium]
MPELVVLPALNELGVVEWGKEVLPANAEQQVIPMALWRYKKPDKQRNDAIIAAIAAFRGALRWVVGAYPDSAPEALRNWYLIPEALKEYHEQTGAQVLDVSRERLSSRSPDVASLALEDYPRLADALRAAKPRRGRTAPKPVRRAP